MIDSWLSELENEYNIEILFACEAGSRAWGTATEQSDHDIRFIYRCKDIRSYLSIRKNPAVLDLSSPYDAVGYDIYKAIELIRKSNPGIYEWVYSPEIYKNKGSFLKDLTAIIEEEYSPFSLLKHYQSLKTRNLKEISRKKSFSPSAQKQLIHVIRAELISQGIIRNKKVLSPFHLLEESAEFLPAMNEAYIKVSDAKRKGSLIADSEVQDIISLMESKSSSIEVKADLLKKDQPSIDVLDKWLSKILDLTKPI